MIAFAEAVGEFCAIIDRLDDYSPYQLLRQLDEWLPRLYSMAHTLPDLVFDDDVEDPLEREREAISREHDRRSVYWDKVMPAVRDKMKSHWHYSLIFDPVADQEPVESEFGHDIGSVYGDLKEALDIFRIGSEAAAQQAAWDWKWGLYDWGKHALNALAATHALIHYHYDEGDEEFTP
jgi:hypothetical protein